MTNKRQLSGPRLATLAGLIAGAAGIVVLNLAGVPMPAVPPGLVLLLVAALAMLTRWRWAPAVGILVGLFEILGGFVAAGTVTDLFDPSSAGVLIGTWIRAVGVLTAVVAGTWATSRPQGGRAAPSRGGRRDARPTTRSA